MPFHNQIDALRSSDGRPDDDKIPSIAARPEEMRQLEKTTERWLAHRRE